MKAIEVENQLREVVSRLMTEVDLSSRQGRQDVNLVSEDAWIPVLKEVFQCPNLVNLNKKQKNFPGIDLGDELDRVAFQITATTDLEKVKHTLKQFKDRNYRSSFDELYVFTITKKQKSYSQESIDRETDGSFPFSAKDNIIDPGDILERITQLRIGAQQRLLRQFQVILGDIEERLADIEPQEMAPFILVSNLVEVSFPTHVYVSELKLDKETILEMAAEQLEYKKKKPGPATLVRLALVMAGYPKQGWVIHENKFISFVNPDEEPAIRDIVDIGTIEEIESGYFFNSDLDEYRKLFSWLLRDEFKDACEKRKVGWHKQFEQFFFMPNEEGELVRKESWVGKVSAVRTVYEVKHQKKDPSKIAHQKHQSFRAAFHNIDGKCFCTLIPGWIYTYDGYKKSMFHKQLLTAQKRLEHNATVRNMVRFIAYFLSNSVNAESGSISFGGLVELECDYSPSSVSEENPDEGPHEEEGVLADV